MINPVVVGYRPELQETYIVIDGLGQFVSQERVAALIDGRDPKAYAPIYFLANIELTPLLEE